jgi:beta-galactosidase
VLGIPLLAMFGAGYQELRIEGLIGGEVVAEQRISADGLLYALTLEADDAELRADGTDMTRLVFRVVDQYGNRQPFHTAAVTFTVEGPGRLIGENPFALVGGQAAVYLAAGESAGVVTITARAPRLPEARVQITLIEDTRAQV